ncbi:conserved hypothetical protein [Desulforapulum autotrophicum HRM2]|uniref:SCP2 domain-containing protein n=1 Tax=Desulforapulum autotrophicum (strain ATCC 43914 / DSM 3382 / VKM B-1955 / HRM2) TaxID=177437 RepID=C0QFD1_DESAH|nr:hypothetical protein [Desulforapulum autotrophicum]ACN13327.1 conserved hypothetical protein [Desulforapulum autotrophicum HRM2]
MEDFVEIKPGGAPLKRIYLNLMLWFVGRAVQAASKVDPAVRQEFDSMPMGFIFSLGAFPSGPWMVVEKDANGRVKYLGQRVKDRNIDLRMTLKSMDALLLLFTFQESTPVSNARNRLFVEGEVPHACTVVRILDMVQVYLLPKFIAKRAIKRYPRWSLKRHTLDRIQVNIRTLIGC